ncbi:zinc finger protein 658B-like isoform X9 [Vespa velutina]|uniref:zinc finger protein 658B-like isoform X1 n=2 Tax=Vespa TaxID=7443 RepID=UPI001F003BC2|nr:zinc finger protein 658B-like isoform X1 [Vespa crabro]XP_047348504.1 zinc finger protein 658B-like isoform X9 [Vespa velutina]
MRTTPRSSPALVERVFASTGAAFASRAGVLHGKMSSLDYLDLCRLCLVKDRVSVPIFEGEGDVRQIFLKITACLPVKVDREDKLPKKICDDCVYKVELFYQFWNTSVNAEKQLLQWLGEVGLEEKPDYVTNVLNQNVMKPDPSGGNRLDGSMMQQVSGHQNNMGIGMMDNISLSMPMMMSTTNQQQITSVPMDASGSSVQEMPGTSTQSTHEQITQSQTNTSNQHEEEEESSEEEENSEDECDGEEGLPVKEESEEDPNNSRVIEPTTFVNVSLACDEAGPSGLQQQKVTEMPEMAMQQSTDGDPKSGYFDSKITIHHQAQEQQQCGINETKNVFSPESSNPLINDPLDVAKMENAEIMMTEETILRCTFCGDVFVDEHTLVLHLQSHEQVPDESFVCEHCGCNYPTSLALIEHQEEHAIPEKNYSCESCDYVTLHRPSLVIHQKRHGPQLRYQCEICGLGFTTRNSYQDHQLLHSREKPFQCEICNATFRYRQGLRLHAKLHQPDYVPPQKKHHCELCNKRFSRKQVLLVHMKTHGNVGPSNEYVCPICGKAVSSKTYLTVHLRKHTGEKPHVCDLCGKGFISQNYLSVHRRTHTGERPHKCTHCEKRFTQRTTLVVHLRGHTGDRPYPCTYCHKSFASKTMLNSHLKTHAKQNARQQQEQQRRELQQQQYQQLQQHEQQQALDTVTILLPS